MLLLYNLTEYNTAMSSEFKRSEIKFKISQSIVLQLEGGPHTCRTSELCAVYCCKL